MMIDEKLYMSVPEPNDDDYTDKDREPGFDPDSPDPIIDEEWALPPMPERVKEPEREPVLV